MVYTLQVLEIVVHVGRLVNVIKLSQGSSLSLERMREICFHRMANTTGEALKTLFCISVSLRAGSTVAGMVVSLGLAHRYWKTLSSPHLFG